jgi:hypothetical protein
LATQQSLIDQSLADKSKSQGMFCAQLCAVLATLAASMLNSVTNAYCPKPSTTFLYFLPTGISKLSNSNFVESKNAESTIPQLLHPFIKINICIYCVFKWLKSIK